ncbi:uncharacterized protein L3040_004609 [Drepanopeziza brunnea f. sp. 'multigermtubi']|uniref:Uncharacterized protein n=1 Tax=Marssonina brunnea f. sp. multigermtubi (strain MB_m1) TaxID=1072389 RepID=K1WTL3_MARBU|nr:uncharacterized protein MBM_00103 [Drepanopeziza brunnea f. sp. 'multigermtubi' MB_m1]EKD20990.1 hypothetical protein MBM_00103 [Drepanopeziza brunnea f. sp. 'multigermtubi' MB_m1]KAJ5042050.1 hypothetical protein L3040_004609 [Drepanopeziza brunnea f. sp. 'multigermtubi']
MTSDDDHHHHGKIRTTFAIIPRSFFQTMSKYVRQDKSVRKHPVPSSATSLLRAPDVPAAPKERPGWKGPGFVKKAPKKSTRAVQAVTRAENIQEQHLDPALQQSLLNVFRAALPVCEDYDALKPTLEAIRVSVSQGDFQIAFSKLDWLEVYAVRWSPNRALCVATVLVELCKEFGDEEVCFKSLLRARDQHDTKGIASNIGSAEEPFLNAVCFGGGAAEIMAFAALSRHILPQAAASKPKTPDLAADTGLATSELATPAIELRLCDQADWTHVISSLKTGLNTPPVLSKYASQAARDKNSSFVPPGALRTTFTQRDILQLTQEEIRALVGSKPTLITIFFTLNDLHIVSKAKTASFLMKLGLEAHRDSLLLIIDNSMEAEKVGDQHGKKWSTFKNLLDLVIMDKKVSLWEELVRDSNRAFKLERGLKFPISLENQKIQLHLFKSLPR